MARLEELGARKLDIGQGPDVSWEVMADPEGNELCVVTPAEQAPAAERRGKRGRGSGPSGSGEES